MEVRNYPITLSYAEFDFSIELVQMVKFIEHNKDKRGFHQYLDRLQNCISVYGVAIDDPHLFLTFGESSQGMYEHALYIVYSSDLERTLLSTSVLCTLEQMNDFVSSNLVQSSNDKSPMHLYCLVRIDLKSENIRTRLDKNRFFELNGLPENVYDSLDVMFK